MSSRKLWNPREPLFNLRFKLYLVDGVEDAGVPVEGDQEVVHEAAEAEHVGVVGVPLRPVQELPEPVDLGAAVLSGAQSPGGYKM